MITILCEKREEQVANFAQMVAKCLEDRKLKVIVEDFEQGVSFGSFSIFILTKPIHNIKFWGKFGVFNVNDEISESISSVFPYPPMFTQSITLPVSDVSLLFSMDFNKQVPTIQNYKIPNYFSISSNPEPLSSYFTVGSSTLLCCQEDYQVLSLSLNSSEACEPGCNLSLTPKNSDTIVSEICRFEGYPENLIFSVPGLPGFENSQELKTYLKENCDLTGLIRKPVLKQLAQYCTDHIKREDLEIMTSLKGKERFTECIEKRNLSIVEILIEYEIFLPPGDLVQILDRIKPRFYSLASDGSRNLEIALLNMAKGKYVGCFSRYAWEITQIHGERIKGELKQSVFKLAAGPLLLISNGCGIAPFRGILSYVSKLPETYPNCLLIAGFRSPEHFIYKSEIEDLATNNESIHILICYSRCGTKTYVQDLIQQNEAQVLDFLSSGLTFICGGTQMGKSVTDQLKLISDKNSLDWNSTKTRVKCETWG